METLANIIYSNLRAPPVLFAQTNLSCSSWILVSGSWESEVNTFCFLVMDLAEDNNVQETLSAY